MMPGSLPLPEPQGGLTLEEQASLAPVPSIHRDVSHVHELAQVAEEGMLVASLSAGLPQSLELVKSGSKRKRTQCGKCGEEGHNSRTCKLEYRIPGDASEMGSELGSLKFINKKAKKDKKRNSIRKLEKDRPWPSIKTRLAAKSHYPTKLPEKRPCTWCFNRRCGQKKLTKYHCEHCKVDLCAVPCFKEFHTEEKSHARKSSRSKNRDSEDGDEVLPSSPPST